MDTIAGKLVEYLQENLSRHQNKIFFLKTKDLDEKNVRDIQHSSKGTKKPAKPTKTNPKTGTAKPEKHQQMKWKQSPRSQRDQPPKNLNNPKDPQRISQYSRNYLSSQRRPVHIDLSHDTVEGNIICVVILHAILILRESDTPLSFQNAIRLQTLLR